MKRHITTIIVCASLCMAAGAAVAGNPPDQPPPTRAEIQKQAMQYGPATSQLGYITYKDPAPPHRAAQPVDPKLLRPLTQRELGMLLNACSAYAECKTAYSQAAERYQAQLRAKAVANGQQQ